MSEQNNEIVILDLKTLTSVYFIQNELPLDKFKYDDENKNLKALTEIAKTLKKNQSFKSAKVTMNNETKITKRILRRLKRTGITITSIEIT